MKLVVVVVCSGAKFTWPPDSLFERTRSCQVMQSNSESCYLSSLLYPTAYLSRRIYDACNMYGSIMILSSFQCDMLHGSTPQQPVVIGSEA